MNGETGEQKNQYPHALPRNGTISDSLTSRVFEGPLRGMVEVDDMKSSSAQEICL